MSSSSLVQSAWINIFEMLAIIFCMNWLVYFGIGLAKVNSRLIIKFCVIADGMANWMGYQTSPRKPISVTHLHKGNKFKRPM